QVVPPAIALPATVDSAYVVAHAAAKTGKGNGVVEDDGGCRHAVGASPAIGGSMRRKSARAESACDNAGKTEAPLHRDGAPAVGRRAVTELTGIVEPPAVRGTRRRQAATVRSTGRETCECDPPRDSYGRCRGRGVAVAELPLAVAPPTVGRTARGQRPLTRAARGRQMREPGT